MQKELEEYVLEELHYSMTKDMMMKYDLLKTKKNVELLIEEYKIAKFQYLVSDNVLQQITFCYKADYEQRNVCDTDKIVNHVTKKIDSKDVVDSIDVVLNQLFKKMSLAEKKYYELCLINNNSEQMVCDILGISRTGLQLIKQNCILKIALTFHIEVLK